MQTAECFWDWPKDWPSCPEVFAAWGTGGGVSIYTFDSVCSDVIRRTFGHVRPANVQISMRIRAVCSESSFDKDAKLLHADNEDSDQTARMRRLI